MEEYLEREIKEKSRKWKKEYFLFLFTYLIIVCVGIIAFLFSAIFGSAEWKETLGRFLTDDWISHTGYISNNVLILLGIIAVLLLLSIPFYKKAKEVEELKKQQKKYKNPRG